MVGLILLGVLALVVGGCVCVVWAGRGGPAWVRGVAAVTLALGDVVRGSERRRKRRRSLNGNPSGEG
ncbi:hypothetical protein ABZX93_26445 [Streptomyces sp. NPDC006632]|uniref:hypothetical protein n=1 Tax=Streptomyces sp. NPDC006632 TaxID=3157182 RepID=UPI002E2051A3